MTATLTEQHHQALKITADLTDALVELGLRREVGDCLRRIQLAIVTHAGVASTTT